MLPDLRKANLGVVPLACLLALTACADLGVRRDSSAASATTAAPVDRDTSVALLLANTLQSLQRLAQAGAAEQAEIMAAAKQAYEKAPLGSAQLRYALTLAIPGPVSRDPEKARSLLRELSAQPEALAPVERALMLIEMSQLERELGLGADNRRLQSDAVRGERDRQAVANRRLQAEVDENAKLRKQLDEALAKLDAIALMERNLSDRPTKTEGRKP
jgi:hypothetical protein